jgi:hypothetical protein
LSKQRDKDDFENAIRDHSNPNGKLLDVESLSIIILVSISDFTVHFFQGLLKIEDSQIMTVMKRGDRVEYQHFTFKFYISQTYFPEYKCGLNRVCRKLRLYLPNTATGGLNLAIVNYEPHVCMVSLQNFGIFFRSFLGTGCFLRR